MGLNFEGGDFGFVGGSNTMPDPYQDRQRSFNYYPEISDDPRSKTPIALLGCPGLNSILDFTVMTSGAVLSVTGGCRGVWVLPGGTDALWVFGSSMFLTRMLVPATQTSIAQFGKYYLGPMLTNSGPVCIRDNGPGGKAVIVDGSTTLYIYDIATSAVVSYSDGGTAYLGASRCAFIDGWLIFNKPNSQTFFTNASVPYTTTFSASFFALKDSSSDNLITIMENNRELWLIGERTSEVWYDAGGANFAFSRVPGVSPQVGCSAAQSIARMGPSLVWLGKSERGENVVVKTEQYSYSTISTRAVEAAITSYPQISDATGFAYEEEGHLFYVLTFPTADKTWVYDATTEMWHERGSFRTSDSSFHQFKGSAFANYQNVRMVGDFQSPIGYQMSRQFYVDGSSPLVSIRRAPHLWSKENRKRLFHGGLQIEFAPGVGLQTGQGSNPQAMLRWSDDGGTTFGSEHWTSIGAAGDYKNRAYWRRLGRARDRVYEMSISDPVQRDIVGATLFAQPEQG
jgi:hypothetical protein